jgi:hypothetical protein
MDQRRRESAGSGAFNAKNFGMSLLEEAADAGRTISEPPVVVVSKLRWFALTKR